MARNWLSLYALSLRLGTSHLVRRGYLREAVVRLVVPMDPSRYLEFPETLTALDARPGERILDVASPKLVSVALARKGAEVVSVDAFRDEIETWQALAGHTPGLRFQVADARRLPFADASFDHAYSISVIEHIPEDGDLTAMRELARVVRPGGRIVITTGLSREYSEDWREEPVYGSDAGIGDGPPQAPAERESFFSRTYDEQRLAQLVDAARPHADLVDRRVAVPTPTWLAHAYDVHFPWLLPLGPFLGLILRDRDSPAGGTVRLTLERR